MPEDLLKRASEILKNYETTDNKTNIKQVSLFDLEEPKTVAEESVKYEENNGITREIAKLNLDNLRPIDALNELYKIKDMINKEA